MDYFADIFLGAGALAAAFYCLMLSRKLSRLSGLDQDLGSAIAVLSKQVDEMTRVLSEAKSSAAASSDQLGAMTERAEDVANRLDIMLTALEDLPEIEGETPRPALHAVEDNVQSEPVFLRHSNRASGERA